MMHLGKWVSAEQLQYPRAQHSFMNNSVTFYRTIEEVKSLQPHLVHNTGDRMEGVANSCCDGDSAAQQSSQQPPCDESYPLPPALFSLPP